MTPLPPCEVNRNVRLQPMFEKGKWCHTHLRPISACEEISRLTEERDGFKSAVEMLLLTKQGSGVKALMEYLAAGPNGSRTTEELDSFIEARRALSNSKRGG